MRCGWRIRAWTQGIYQHGMVGGGPVCLSGVVVKWVAFGIYLVLESLNPVTLLLNPLFTLFIWRTISQSASPLERRPARASKNARSVTSPNSSIPPPPPLSTKLPSTSSHIDNQIVIFQPNTSYLPIHSSPFLLSHLSPLHPFPLPPPPHPFLPRRTLATAQRDVKLELQRINEQASEAAVGCGESDLRRLKRQFKSMKNTFIQYDVKDSFMEALQQGRPCAEEEQFLVQYTAEVDQFESSLRAQKAQNSALKDDITALVSHLVATESQLHAKQDVLRADLDALQRSIVAARAAHAARNDVSNDENNHPTSDSVPHHDHGKDADEQTLQAALQAEAERARDLERRLAEVAAASRECEHAATAEEANVERLRQQLREVEAVASAEVQVREKEAAHADMDAWLASVLGLVEGISGMELVGREERGATLRVRNMRSGRGRDNLQKDNVDAGAGAAVDAGAGADDAEATPSHEVRVTWDVKGRPESVTVVPEVPGTEALVEEARRLGEEPAFVVMRVRSLLRQQQTM